jgi:hypothetical protein
LVFPLTGIPTLSDEIKDKLGGEITYAELTPSIKRMKNEKSPGSDGSTSEFLVESNFYRSPELCCV